MPHDLFRLRCLGSLFFLSRPSQAGSCCSKNTKCRYAQSSGGLGALFARGVFCAEQTGCFKVGYKSSIGIFKSICPLSVTLSSFQKAEIFAQSIGFQNINDCIHTAIAEATRTELVTFNHSDFKRIQPLTNLKITLL